MNHRPKLLITGASGQVGAEFQALADQFPQFDFHFTTRKELDIGEVQQVRELFETQHYDYCINCAAYTAVDLAEKERELAEKINITAVENLATICAKQQIPLIHFSTDYVYHGSQNRPFCEDDPTFPEGIYAATKLAGEAAALKLNAHTMIIRTSWVYSPFGHNFVKTMLRLGQQRPELSVVFDQVGTPTYAYDLALAVLNILQQVTQGKITADQLSGIFNYSNEGVTSWYDFALAIFEIRNLNCAVVPIESKDYPTPASRPFYSVLNKGKIKRTFDLNIPHWRDRLMHCLDRLPKTIS
ncbi:MAG: NAD(P)-dependent oxidoreductase [Saprospiraceae bacterium]|nr:MAG: NAD(P)-dependent oxidoreductase [Saprospiraceae bacterium]